MRSAFVRRAHQKIEPLGEIGMGEASEIPVRCGGAQGGEEAVEFEGAALFETRDFRFGFGLFESLKSLAGLVLPRAISASICSIKVRCKARAAKRGSGGAWSVSNAAVQAAMRAASMISPEPAEGLGPLQAKHGTATQLLALEQDDLESLRPQMSCKSLDLIHRSMSDFAIHRTGQA